ncbi:MAG: aminopeptidase [Methanomassiliicoccales archaeon]|nr:MAG: aminopeptidase [Methanomassiliicoccales archaeon]
MTNAFNNNLKIEEELKKAASVAINEVLGTQKDEKILIITNPEKDVQSISMALYDAALDAGALPVLIFQPVKTQLDFAEESVISAIKSNPDIILSISRHKLGKDKWALKDPYKVGDKEYDNTFTYLLGEKKMRSFWSPSVTARMFAETVPIDYTELREICKKIKDELDLAIEVHITAPSGTDIVIGLAKREAKADDGNFKEMGRGGNLPCGEVFISPELGTSHGTIGFDGSITVEGGEVIIKTPIMAEVENGFVTKITGKDEADELKGTIKKAESTVREFVSAGKIPKEMETSYIQNARNLGELGIGLNKNAKIVGNMLEDEKVYGTCHIAIGSNYDEDAKSLIHLDGLIKEPTISVKYEDGGQKTIIENGQVL